MESSEHGIYKEQLEATAAGRGEGIDLDTPERWVIEGLRQPVEFFRHVQFLIPSDSILYLEGINVAPEVASFYESHRAMKGAVSVVRDTIFPVPEIYHVQMEPGVVDGLVSDRIALEQIQVFCETIGLSFRRERNENKRNPEVSRALLRAMENPAKVRILWPWWKRALFFWKK